LLLDGVQGLLQETLASFGSNGHITGVFLE